MQVAQGCDGRLVIGSGFAQLVDFNFVKLRLGFGLLGAQLCDPPEQSSLLVLKRRELRAVCSIWFRRFFRSDGDRRDAFQRAALARAAYARHLDSRRLWSVTPDRIR